MCSSLITFLLALYVVVLATVPAPFACDGRKPIHATTRLLWLRATAMVGARHNATAVAAPVPDGPSLVAPSHTHGHGPRAGASRAAAGDPTRRPRPGVRGLAWHTQVATASKAEFGAGCGGVRGLALAAGSTVVARPSVEAQAVAPLRLEAQAATPLRPGAEAAAPLRLGAGGRARSARTWQRRPSDRKQRRRWCHAVSP